MSPALNESSALQCFERGSAVEIHNNVLFLRGTATYYASQRNLLSENICCGGGICCGRCVQLVVSTRFGRCMLHVLQESIHKSPR